MIISIDHVCFPFPVEIIACTLDEVLSSSPTLRVPDFTFEKLPEYHLLLSLLMVVSSEG